MPVPKGPVRGMLCAGGKAVQGERAARCARAEACSGESALPSMSSTNEAATSGRALPHCKGRVLLCERAGRADRGVPPAST